MLRISTLSSAAFLVAIVATTPANAQQQEIVSSSDIDAALAENGRSVDGHHAQIHRFLDQPAVAQAMQRVGIDADRLRASVATLDEAQARAFADRLETATEEQAGGDVLVISTSTVIIALLIVLIIVVAD